LLLFAAAAAAVVGKFVCTKWYLRQRRPVGRSVGNQVKWVVPATAVARTVIKSLQKKLLSYQMLTMPRCFQCLLCMFSRQIICTAILNSYLYTLIIETATCFRAAYVSGENKTFSDFRCPTNRVLQRIYQNRILSRS
jgi:hypothetical protein